MSTHASPKIAIIGSGPAGCYLAQSLVRGAPDARLTLIDRLASPFGLIRYGVAADHQHTKAITRQFERLFQSGSVRFAGNVEIGRDLSLEELAEQYDAVVLATGLSVDRPLGVPGDRLPGVIGAGEITRTLNAHPDEGQQLPTLGSTPVIIGAGNVAIDILRFLVKDREGFEGSDISDSALDAYLAAPADRITLVSRSSAAESKGDPQMLKELAALPRATYTSPDDLTIDPETAPDRTAAARVAAIADMVSAERPEHPGPRVTLRFGLRPVRILGNERVEGVEFASGDETIVVPATSVLTAIGFSAFADDQLAELVAEHSEIGRIEPGLYRTGWAKRGPRGAIPENRACAKSVADEILADLAD
ncbi:MAG: FAD-dependent oxidoreductase, partial [Leucobacter sp.]|nr:FAD-dependent oxidoreductase [Leucobacter sp.]